MQTSNSFMQSSIVKEAIFASFKKLDPRTMIHNPLIFLVEICTFLTLILAIVTDYQRGYTVAIFIILFLTLLLSNFAESLAEGRGKAQANSLKETKSDTLAKRILNNGKIEQISSTALHKGNIVLVEAGDIIPSDGEIIEGLASVDESAITGESAPVIKESGGDFSSVTGGTKVISDWIKVKITSDPGESFLDKMISLVEGASRQKTPNEIALNLLLLTLTAIFILVVITLVPIAKYVGIDLGIATLAALLVCLMPTTIGALLSAIGIAGMDRVTRFNVLAMSGKAVEAAGDINTIILDKTGTITFGNRRAAEFIPVLGQDEKQLQDAAAITSFKDETPEGRSIVELAVNQGCNLSPEDYTEFIPFLAETRMSGTDYKGIKYRKGSVDSIIEWVKAKNGSTPSDLKQLSESVSSKGGTPLAVAKDNLILGLIYLKDTVKPGMKERFEQLRKMGIKSIMATGDNKLTAATISVEAGVDEYIAESKPEDKIEVIKKEQAQGKLVAMTGDGTNDAPALAQADVGLAMNSGTVAAKEAANMIDLDSDPTKIIEVVSIGKQLLMTRGALTTFSIASDVAKYFVVLPSIFTVGIPQMSELNFMYLGSPQSSVISALIFNAIIIPLLVPLAIKGVKYTPMPAGQLLRRNLIIYGLSGLVAPFIGIKLIDYVVRCFI